MTKLNNSAYNNGVNWHERIVSDESVLLGKPTVKGTRISIEFILERLADGWTEQQLLENYPRLTRDDLQAVFSYAADCLKDGLMFEIDLSVK